MEIARKMKLTWYWSR